MDYSSLAHFAQTFGLLFFVVLFVAVVVYAFWPAHKARFEHAAKLPLSDDFKEKDCCRGHGDHAS